MSGEVGEIAEIFQWKGPTESGIVEGVFSTKEIINVGEEVADVFIYSTRLCDLCGIDMACAARYCASNPLTGQPNDEFTTRCTHPFNQPWDGDTLTFKELEEMLRPSISVEKSPRRVALLLSSKCGKVCDLFQVKSESASLPGLPGWSNTEKVELALLMGSIALLLMRLALMARTTLDMCISDKLRKNDAKYPADLVQGSSAKYTAYESRIQKAAAKSTAGAGSNQLLSVLGGLTLCAVGVVVGMHLGKNGLVLAFLK